jgi:hypothetical protein
MLFHFSATARPRTQQLPLFHPECLSAVFALLSGIFLDHDQQHIALRRRVYTPTRIGTIVT